jgi:very-short-patch-repair endonuclease
MEVDLSCSEARIAIEIDGPQHLYDTEAYRKDRDKDFLLQENGWIVLRCLAEDITKNLDTLLSNILRLMATRTR